MIHLDTHIAARLADGDRKLRKLQSRLERETVCLSPFAILELQALIELGRLAGPLRPRLEVLHRNFGVQVATEPLVEIVNASLALSWTRDPFDRLLVAHAIAADALLLTFDAHIQAHFARAIVE
ncbi:MAG: PIN domain-containing protein [Myxococcaceae bacterium]|nr:PIN domain-containing protein [Myxococcaceae bacterium]